LHGEVGIVAYVRRIATAELEPGADEPVGRRALHRVAARDRPGERDEVHARIANHALGVRVAQVQGLESALGQAGLAQAFVEPFRAQRCLRRVLEDYDVAAIKAGTTLFTAIRYG